MSVIESETKKVDNKHTANWWTTQQNGMLYSQKNRHQINNSS